MQSLSLRQTKRVARATRRRARAARSPTYRPPHLYYAESRDCRHHGSTLNGSASVMYPSENSISHRFSDNVRRVETIPPRCSLLLSPLSGSEINRGPLFVNVLITHQFYDCEGERRGG